MGNKFVMSKKERNQMSVLDRLVRKELTQQNAALMLKITDRQVRNKLKRYIAEGASGLVHLSRGRPSKKCWNQREPALELVKNYYPDFGPTFAAEKLEECHKIIVSSETLRKAMLEVGLWHRQRKHKKHRRRREPRKHFGMLIQFDGSPHDWFEGRGPSCTLLVAVDDATRELLLLKFVRSESTISIMNAMKEYIEQHGRPLAFYTDKHSVVKVNNKNPEGEFITQLERALKELDIGLIRADSPQAKGRVERANLTLQDRLVKELRLQSISTMEEANAFASRVFIPHYNKKFSIRKTTTKDLHRLAIGYNLYNIFSRKEKRILQNDYTIQYQKRIFQIEKTPQVRIYPKEVVNVYVHLDEKVSLFTRNKNLQFTEIGIRSRKTRNPVAYVNQANLRKLLVLKDKSNPLLFGEQNVKNPCLSNR